MYVSLAPSSSALFEGEGVGGSCSPITFCLLCKQDPHSTQVSRMSIVDLAGSERTKNTGNTGTFLHALHSTSLVLSD